jgi:hypothetical protein
VPATRRIDAMDLEPRLLLALEFDVNTEPVSGIVRDGDGDGDRFSGWMDLTRTIELAVAAARYDDDATPSHKPPGVQAAGRNLTLRDRGPAPIALVRCHAVPIAPATGPSPKIKSRRSV